MKKMKKALALLLAVPLALLVGLLAVLFPAKTYERAKWSDSLQQTLADAADKLTLFRRDTQTGQVRFTSPISPSTLGSYLWDSSVTGVNLNRVGPQRQYGRTVMRVQGQTSGLCHLRGDSLAVYEENRWKALSERDYAEAGDAVSALTAGAVRIAASEEEEAGFSAVSAAYSMSIETEMKSGVYYTPYYPLTLPEGAAPYHDAYIRNSSQRTSYAVLYTDAHTDVPDETYEAFVHETYTQVPDQTRQALADILQQLDVQPGDDPHRILAAVQSYVSSSARYDLNTPAVPDGEDFVSWFLHESETGYCVHFATAAAILLRCMDVPARYVTGFSTNVTAGSWTTVTTDDAHAWVEYYVDGLGWYVLDPTPAMQDSLILTLQPDNSSETDPAQTQEEDQVHPSETPTTETTSDAPEVSPETSDKPTGTNQESSKTFHFFRYLWPILAAAAALLIWRALLLIPVVTRCMAGVAVETFAPMQTSQYASGFEAAQHKRQLTVLAALNALAAAAGLLLLKSAWFTVSAIGAELFALLVCRAARKNLGGMSGDISGFSMTLGELAGLLLLLAGQGALWS